MKKIMLAVIFAALTLLLGACGSESSSAKKESEVPRVAIPNSAVEQTVADMKASSDVSNAEITVNGDKINARLVVENTSVGDDKRAISFADSLLRTLPSYIDEAESPTKDSYGSLYNGYYVNIIVEDGSGVQLVEGNMYPGLNSITWK